MTYRIAFIGLGSIGQDVLEELAPLLSSIQAEVLVLRRQAKKAGEKGPYPFQTCTDIADLLTFAPHLVIEVAGQEAVKSYVPACLKQGTKVVITSVGALADADLLVQLQQLEQQHSAQMILPSGAIGGLDYIHAVRQAPDLQIHYESRKPVQAWLPELEALDIKPETVNKEIVLFEGNASEAASRYPQNLNVAATLALAGMGMDATKVKVIVDPALEQNKHTIRVSSQFGEMSMDISNAPSPSNPKSSWIVAQSVRSVVEQQLSAQIKA